jgi:hypothetical protein
MGEFKAYYLQASKLSIRSRNSASAAILLIREVLANPAKEQNSGSLDCDLGRSWRKSAPETREQAATVQPVHLFMINNWCRTFIHGNNQAK